MDRPRPQRRQGGVRLPVAALSRLRADLEPDVHEDRRARDPHHRSAQHGGVPARSPQVPVHGDDRRQHPVPGAARRARVRRRRPAQPQAGERRGDGGPARRRRTLGEGHRRAAHRGLRPDRNLAGRDLESARHRAVDRDDRHADPLHRGRDPERRRRRSRARRGRRDLRARAAGHGGLLEPPRRDATRVHRRRLASGPATWAPWTSAATSGSPTARRT